ncbi:MAG TPA: DUF89 family protein [Thermoplasmatales archaeon]|nr:DUF89 family protein [Thermoplasmatales archaeon]
MKTYLDCIPCFLNQTLEAVRMVSNEEDTHEILLKKVMKYLYEINSFNIPPPEISREVHEIIRKELNCKDPYKEVKKKSNEMANKLYSKLRKMVEKADDVLLTATKLAIAGNVIDFGSVNRYDVREMIEKAIRENVNENAYSLFKERVEKAHTILYIADNAGEIFFDKLLLEVFLKMRKKMIYAVKKNPIINDATMEDVKLAGIDALADAIIADDGNISAPGILLRHASPHFLKYFETADMIIAKGQGNYESLSDTRREIFFLLVVKCPLVARDIGEEVGKFIIKVNK